MSKTSAGILLFHRNPDPEYFLAHPGGPYWKNKDEGAWSIPKGLIGETEEKLEAAVREFEEEIGFRPEGNFLNLGSIRQKGGKQVHAWAVEMDLPDSLTLDSNTFEMEWPPNSGKKQRFPEIDRAAFFPEEVALDKINPAQAELIYRLREKFPEDVT